MRDGRGQFTLYKGGPSAELIKKSKPKINSKMPRLIALACLAALAYAVNLEAVEAAPEDAYYETELASLSNNSFGYSAKERKND